MKAYKVIRPILNIRSKPSLEDDTFVGELSMGETVWLNDETVTGPVPYGASTSDWLVDHYGNVVHSEGVSLTWAGQKAELIATIKNFWNRSTGAGVVVGLFDEGVMINHPNMSSNITRYHCFLNGAATGAIPTPDASINNARLKIHGTWMAGLMAGHGGSDIIGIAPDVMIHDFKISQPNGQRVNFNLEAALRMFATQPNPSIVNMSWEFPQSIITNRTAIDTVINDLINKGVIVVSATGDLTCSSGTPSIRYPGNSPGVITVGAICNGVPVDYASCTGSLAAAGIKTPDCFIEMDDWMFCDAAGAKLDNHIHSSETTAVMSALISLKKQLNPLLNQSQVKSMIRSSCTFYMKWLDMEINKLNIKTFLNA